ncbi:MAG TPA: hypothetical protein VKE29_00420 [Candidatus Udaeobacter sp.]|nr:hypothetical protein [Candidatus Udaeobacter sp.]
MLAQPGLFSILIISRVLLVPFLRVQDNPMDDPDLQQLPKQS